MLYPIRACVSGNISRISNAGQGSKRGILYRFGLAASNSAFCEASLKPERMHNHLILLTQPLLNVKDIGRHGFHIVNPYLRSLSFKNVWSSSVCTFLPFPYTEGGGLYIWTNTRGQFNFQTHSCNY